MRAILVFCDEREKTNSHRIRLPHRSSIRDLNTILFVSNMRKFLASRVARRYLTRNTKGSKRRKMRKARELAASLGIL